MTRNDIKFKYHQTEIGELILGSYNSRICLLDFRYRKIREVIDRRLQKGLNAEFIQQEDGLIKDLQIQIDRFLSGRSANFDFPVITVGTDFQKRVWREIIKIPIGKTTSYLSLAKSINKPEAVRAVAGAVAANAIALIIPCHRVIGSDGKLGGYGGGQLAKRRLLDLEHKL